MEQFLASQLLCRSSSFSLIANHRLNLIFSLAEIVLNLYFARPTQPLTNQPGKKAQHCQKLEEYAILISRGVPKIRTKVLAPPKICLELMYPLILTIYSWNPT